MNYKDENFILNQKYKVIGIFDYVINLQLNDKVYSIFNENISKAPYSLILNNKEFRKFKKISRINGTLYIPNMKYEEFNCYLSTNQNEIEISVIEKIIETFERSDSIFERAFQQKRKEKDLLGLIGLGLGLTPSGDDYIVGIMSAYYSKFKNTPKIFENISIKSQTQTNFISHNYIKNAKNRLFKQEIIDVIEDITDSSKIHKLLSFGSSSGQDILYGIYDYYKGNIEIE